jgi:hypothetical protein
MDIGKHEYTHEHKYIHYNCNVHFNVSLMSSATSLVTKALNLNFFTLQFNLVSQRAAALNLILDGKWKPEGGGALDGGQTLPVPATNGSGEILFSTYLLGESVLSPLCPFFFSRNFHDFDRVRDHHPHTYLSPITTTSTLYSKHRREDQTQVP